MQPNGIVLAAGEAARFGTLKQVFVYRGRPMLEHAVAVTAEYCRRVIVVLGSAGPDIEAAVDLHGAECVHCDNWRLGTFASLSCGLQALGSDWNEVIVVLGDQPGLTPERIDAVRAVDGPIARALALGKPSHPVVIRRDALVTRETLRRAPGIELGSFPDVDTPQDVAAADAYMSGLSCQQARADQSTRSPSPRSTSPAECG